MLLDRGSARLRAARLSLLAGLIAGCSAPVPPPHDEAAARLIPAIEGDVAGPAGEPIAGALVSVSSHFDLQTSEPAHDERPDVRPCASS